MASTYLSQTQGSGNRRTWTISAWVKRANTGASHYIFNTRTTDDDVLQFDASDRIQFFINGASGGYLITNRLFRDTSAWYHIVVAVDTTQATSSDRNKIWINGVQETSFSTETYSSLNYDTQTNLSGSTLNIGKHTASTNYFDGEMTHFHFIDGTAYDADTFGETDATTGIWKPKTAPSVTYGNNGFFLKFENSGSMGTDSSGNGNNFTVNGTMTQTIDTPSNVFATYNPLDIKSGDSNTYANGNTTLQVQTTGGAGSRSTLAVTSGKYYAEFKHNTTGSDWTGVAPYERPAEDANTSSESVLIYSNIGSGWTAYVNGVSQGSGGIKNSFSTGEILMLALDMDNDLLYVGVDGGWFNGTDCSGTSPSNGFSLTANRTYAFKTLSGSTATNVNANFGNGYFGTTAVSSAQNPDDGIGIFEYDVPTGYKALCTKSINAQEYD